MSELNPSKLHVKFADGVLLQGPIVPRAYTLTHSDATGDLFLTIGEAVDQQQISGWYTRFMRDEVVAKWEQHEGKYVLFVYCEISKGIGGSRWRASIFKRELPLVLEVFRYGDNSLFERFPVLDFADIVVNFLSNKEEFSKRENYGQFHSYQYEW